MALEKAFMFSPIAMCIENDMILHKDLDVHKYIELLLHTNVGNVGFRYYMQQSHKCKLIQFEFNGTMFIATFPENENDIGYPVDFGENIFSKKFIDQIGPFTENNNAADAVEKDFVNAYVKQLKNPNCMVKAYDLSCFHTMMNDNNSTFYHVGIFSQHSNAKWNEKLIPAEYHDLSNEKLDDELLNKYKLLNV